MFPLLIGAIGAIGAVVSAIKGGSWLSDQIGASGTGASVGGKAGVTAQSDTAANQFEAALAAQGAGQTVPGSSSVTAMASSVAPAAPTILPVHSTDYDVLARTSAGIVAYNHVGEHHGNHAGAFAASAAPA
jgi:hypothetical protein